MNVAAGETCSGVPIAAKYPLERSAASAMVYFPGIDNLQVPCTHIIQPAKKADAGSVGKGKRKHIFSAGQTRIVPL